MSSAAEPAALAAVVAGRFAREALSAGPGEVCAVFRRSFYLRYPGERYACVGERSLGRGPLNALVDRFSAPVLGDRVGISLGGAASWQPEAARLRAGSAARLAAAASARLPDEGLGCLVAGRENALASHAQPALEAVDRWLSGNALGDEALDLLGLGPGLTPSGDDYIGGVMVGLHACGRAPQADALWRRIGPQLAGRTSTLSAAHLRAAAAGEAHEAVHHCLAQAQSDDPDWEAALGRLDAVGHCSGWDALAGAAAVARLA